MSDPLTIWREKQIYLETQLAITADPAQKFALQQQIKECEKEIARLQANFRAVPTTYNQFDSFVKELRTKYKQVSSLKLEDNIQLLIKQFDFFGIEWTTSFGFTVAIIKADHLSVAQIESLFKSFIQINDFLYKNPKALDISYLIWLVGFTLSGALCFVFEKEPSQAIREFVLTHQKAAAAYEKGLSSFFWVQSTATSLCLAVNLQAGKIDNSTSVNKKPDNSNFHAINTTKSLNKLENIIKEICQITLSNQSLRNSTPMSQQNSMKDVFLCHASEDKASVVRPLYQALTAANITCWLDEAEIQWGDSITKKVNDALANSRYVIVVLSEAVLNKNWPQRELFAVLNLEASSGEVKILPLIVGERTVLAKLPLLNDKAYLSWNNDPQPIVSALAKRLNIPYTIVNPT